MPRNLYLFGPLMLAFVFAGCDETPSGPEAEQNQLARTLVTAAIKVESKLAWLPGSDQVAALTYREVSPLKVVDVVTGNVIDVGAVCGFSDSGYAWGYDLVTPRDGSAIYYVCDGQLGFTTASGGQTTVLRTNACPQIALSPDGASLAYAVCGWDDDDSSGYVQPDSLFLRDLESGHETYLRPFGRPIAFSPDGAELLYWTDDRTTWSLSVRRITIADGTESELFRYDNTTSWPDVYRWDAHGVHLLYTHTALDAQGGRWIKNLTTGETIRFVMPLSQFGFGRAYEWSVDGSRLAFGKEECLSSVQGSHGSECRLYRNTLWVSNPYTARSILVAYSDDPWKYGWTEGWFPAAATMEPDGKRIAYILREGLFVSELPSSDRVGIH